MRLETNTKTTGRGDAEALSQAPLARLTGRALRQLAAAAFFPCVLLAAQLPGFSGTLYLGGDGAPDATLGSERPEDAPLANYDPDRDTMPGLLITRGGSGAAELNPALYQSWSAPSTGLELDGAYTLVFWAGMRNFSAGLRGVVEAYLLDCDALGAGCTTIASGRRDITDWNAGRGYWTKNAISFGRLSHSLASGRSLAIKLVVGADSDDDMWFAYGTERFPARLSDVSASDIVVDCDFADWDNGFGAEFSITDEGGTDDWASPANLDVTRFAVSSNLVDTFNILIGFDDVPAHHATAGTLVDTDRDGFGNFAFVVTLDGEEKLVELYSCADTLVDGCENAVLKKSYAPESYCAASGMGPWNTDSFVELELPFNDLEFSGGPVFLSTLFSYAAANLLTSRKDSILGSPDQDYAARIFFDGDTGTAVRTGPVGTGFLVRRASDPATARAAAPHATPGSAPFDDLPGSLTTGENYFYVVEQDGGVPVSLSVHAHESDAAVRLGFDDGDAWNAPIDGALSTVSLDASTVVADGTSVAVVTVTPRDGLGTPVGTGASVSVDGSLLQPASLARPVEDLEDGRYRIEISSMTAGTVVVRIGVEGVDLIVEPEIMFE
jgi:hypothetical protein